jgi:hypothetical protein
MLMRTLSLSLAGTAILALLGGLGGTALAQMDADAEAVYATWVSDGEVTSDAGSESATATLYSSRDGVFDGPVEFSDPRVSGQWTTSPLHQDVDRSTGQGIMWGTLRVENDGGTWEGPMSGVIYQAPEGGFYTTEGWLTGDGDYAGYTFFFQEERDQAINPPRVFRGIIYKGQPPAD